MTDGEWREVQEAVEELVKNFKTLAERSPQASMQGDDFDALLRRARIAFPQSAAVRDLKEVNGVTTLADLIGKLSVLRGAAKAAVGARIGPSFGVIKPRQRNRL